MNSIGILSMVSFVLFSAANALQCRLVTGTIACRFGFDVDAQRCAYCLCHTKSKYCLGSVIGHDCGTLDCRHCLSSHVCQLDFSGLASQCCLKHSVSTAGLPKTTTVRAITSTTSMSTRRPLKQLLVPSVGLLAAVERSSALASTTQSSVTNSDRRNYITLVQKYLSK